MYHYSGLNKYETDRAMKLKIGGIIPLNAYNNVGIT